MFHTWLTMRIACDVSKVTIAFLKSLILKERKLTLRAVVQCDVSRCEHGIYQDYLSECVATLEVRGSISLCLQTSIPVLN